MLHASPRTPPRTPTGATPTTTGSSSSSTNKPRLKQLLLSGGVFTLNTGAALFIFERLLSRVKRSREQHLPHPAHDPVRDYQKPRSKAPFGPCSYAMCPIRADARMPTKPGVYWRDTAQWWGSSRFTLAPRGFRS